MSDPDIRFDKLLIPYNGDAPTASRENSQFYGFISESTGATAVQNQFTGSRQRIIQSPPIPSIGATNEISDPNNVFNPTTGIYSFPFLNGTNNTVVFTYEVEYIVKVINNSTSTRWLRKDISNQGDLRIKPRLIISNTNASNIGIGGDDLSGDTPINLHLDHHLLYELVKHNWFLWHSILLMRL